MNNLRFTETNSADDSKGKTWGLDGNLFWYVAGGAFSSVTTFLFLFSVLQLSFVTALGCSVVPLGVVLVYVFGFRQGKPSGYDMDFFERWVCGSGFGADPRRYAKHPMGKDNRYV